MRETPCRGSGTGLGARQGCGRVRRMGVLLAAVTLLGLGDLYATLLHLRSVGMAEVNPIAAHLMAAGNVPALIVFKLACMALAVGLMWWVRRHLAAELGTWLLFGLMAVLTVHWYQYNEMVKDTFDSPLPYTSEPMGYPDWHYAARSEER